MNLLISKINDLEVIQVGDSKISIENKSEDGGKKGRKKTSGSNKTVDLGKGKIKHTINIYSQSHQNNDDLLKILHDERFCTITDKFSGKMNVYVNLIGITNSDKHVGQTIFEVTCTVQDDTLPPAVNFEVKLGNEVELMEMEIEGMVNELGENASNVETIRNSVTETENFVDKALETVREGIEIVLDAKKTVLDAYLETKSKIDTAKRLVETIKGIKDFPNELTSLLQGLTGNDDTNTQETIENDNDEVSKPLKNTEKSEPTPIAVATVGHNEPATQENVENLSQEALDLYERSDHAANLVNKTKAIRDIKLILEGGFNSDSDFENTVNSTVERLEGVGYTREEISEKVFLIKSFANSQIYKEIIEIEVKRPEPLMSIVYGLYGDLNNYASIEAINGFVENDYVSGMVKVFA